MPECPFLPWTQARNPGAEPRARHTAALLGPEQGHPQGFTEGGAVTSPQERQDLTRFRLSRHRHRVADKHRGRHSGGVAKGFLD